MTQTTTAHPCPSCERLRAERDEAIKWGEVRNAVADAMTDYMPDAAREMALMAECDSLRAKVAEVEKYRPITDGIFKELFPNGHTPTAFRKHEITKETIRKALDEWGADGKRDMIVGLLWHLTLHKDRECRFSEEIRDWVVQCNEFEKRAEAAERRAEEAEGKVKAYEDAIAKGDLVIMATSNNPSDAGKKFPCAVVFESTKGA